MARHKKYSTDKETKVNPNPPLTADFDDAEKHLSRSVRKRIARELMARMKHDARNV
jgi:hypothetical protein